VAVKKVGDAGAMTTADTDTAAWKEGETIGAYSQGIGTKSQDVIAASVARDGVLPLAS
jgi:hypothetical protein